MSEMLDSDNRYGNGGEPDTKTKSVTIAVTQCVTGALAVISVLWWTPLRGFGDPVQWWYLPVSIGMGLAIFVTLFVIGLMMGQVNLVSTLVGGVCMFPMIAPLVVVTAFTQGFFDPNHWTIMLLNGWLFIVAGSLSLTWLIPTKTGEVEALDA